VPLTTASPGPSQPEALLDPECSSSTPVELCNRSDHHVFQGQVFKFSERRMVMRTLLTTAVALLSVAWMTALLSAQAPERASRPFLGIWGEGTAIRAEQPGVLIRQVDPGSPAAQAGLKSGDVITKVDNQEVKTFDTLVNTLVQHKPGDKVTVQVRREGKDQDVAVTLGQRPAPRPGAAPGRQTPFLGVETRELTPQAKDRLGVSVDQGAEVMGVVRGTPATKAGLQPGDVITNFNDKPINNPQELREAVRQAGVGKEVSFQAARGKEMKDFKVQLEEAPAGAFIPPSPR